MFLFKSSTDIHKFVYFLRGSFVVTLIFYQYFGIFRRLLLPITLAIESRSMNRIINAYYYADHLRQLNLVVIPKIGVEVHHNSAS